MMKCESCGAEAAIHVTEVDADGTARSRHLCSSCVQEQMGIDTSASTYLPGVVENLRRMAEQLKQGSSPFSSGIDRHSFAARDTKEFAEQLRYLEEVADFIEQHGRFPTENEVPDPFLRP